MFVCVCLFFLAWSRGKGKAQQQANQFPVAAGLKSTAHDAANSLEKLPVGTMANILRVKFVVSVWTIFFFFFLFYCRKYFLKIKHVFYGVFLFLSFFFFTYFHVYFGFCQKFYTTLMVSKWYTPFEG